MSKVTTVGRGTERGLRMTGPGDGARTGQIVPCATCRQVLLSISFSGQIGHHVAMSSSPAGSPGGPAAPPDHARAAEAVRQRRLEFGWTQEQLAERSGVSAATVRKIEAATQPHYRDLTCTRLCSALGWPPEALDLLRSPQRRAATAAIPIEATTAGVDVAITPPSARAVELAALNGRLAHLDARQWERLVAFVDGLTATDG